MTNRTGNYCAFYVYEPFKETNLGANIAKDFVYYNTLRMWKGKDPSFPFVDSHMKNYNVRDGSNWESTLKPRLRARLRASANIILFLSSFTRNSRALREEIDYGINILGLPVIVVYPDYKEKNDIINYKSKIFKQQIIDLWDNLPIFRKSMSKVPTLHIPMDKLLIASALSDPCFKVSSKTKPNRYFY